MRNKIHAKKPLVDAAIEHGVIDVAHELINRMTLEENYQDADGKTALMFAADKKINHVVRKLLEKKVNCALRDKDQLLAVDRRRN